MPVEITFEHDGSHGLVAEGSYIWEAAKRLGAQLGSDCHGRGECDACAVVVLQGAKLLSSPTEAEKKILGARLDQQHRLACQANLQSSGEVIVRAAPRAEPSKDKGGPGKRLRDLPLNQQVGAIIEIEAVAITEALNTVRGMSANFAQKILKLVPGKEASKRQQARNRKKTKS
jgi:ferredoxin